MRSVLSRKWRLYSWACARRSTRMKQHATTAPFPPSGSLIMGLPDCLDAGADDAASAAHRIWIATYTAATSTARRKQNATTFDANHRSLKGNQIGNVRIFSSVIIARRGLIYRTYGGY